MEERVRFCDSCGSVIGWFALFCEQCGSKQKSEAAAPGAATAVSTEGGGAKPASAADEVFAIPEVADARAVVRDLFRAQLRLIHRFREMAEDLFKRTKGLTGDAEGASSLRGPDRRARIDKVSDALCDAEREWEELQRSYNRESESVEEECREHLESAQVDAYLSVDEQDAMATEHAALERAFESSESRLRVIAAAVALARKEAESRFFGMQAASPVPYWICVAAALGLGALSYQMTAGLAGGEWERTLLALAPLSIAAILLGGLAAARR